MLYLFHMYSNELLSVHTDCLDRLVLFRLFCVGEYLRNGALPTFWAAALVYGCPGNIKLSINFYAFFSYLFQFKNVIHDIFYILFSYMSIYKIFKAL